MAAEGEVLADLDRALDHVEREALADLLEAARESIEAHRSGYYKASQALSAAALSMAVHVHLDRKFGEVKRDFIFSDEEEEEIVSWRMTAVLGAVRVALMEYDPMTGTPERPHFNRHATAHRVGKPQYTPENSLTAAMLLTSTIAELDWIAATIERQEAGASLAEAGGGDDSSPPHSASPP